MSRKESRLKKFKKRQEDQLKQEQEQRRLAAEAKVRAQQEAVEAKVRAKEAKRLQRIAAVHSQQRRQCLSRPTFAGDDGVRHHASFHMVNGTPIRIHS